MVDMTKARGAVYALRNPAVAASPVLTADYVIRAFTVSHATLATEQCDGFHAMNGYSIAETVAMKIEGVHGQRSGVHDLRATPRSIYAVY